MGEFIELRLQRGRKLIFSSPVCAAIGIFGTETGPICKDVVIDDILDGEFKEIKFEAAIKSKGMEPAGVYPDSILLLVEDKSIKLVFVLLL